MKAARDFARWVRRYFWRIRLRLWNTHRTFLMTGYSRISRDLRTEEYVYVGPGGEICPGVSIGRYSMFGPRVQVLGNDHVYTTVGTPIIFSGRPVFAATSIGRDVWVGANVIIRAGVTIGDGAVIGAGAVVVCDVPPFTVFGGVPAHFLRRRFENSAAEATHAAMINDGIVGGQYCEPIARVAKAAGGQDGA